MARKLRRKRQKRTKKVLFKSSKHKNIEVHYDKTTNTYYVHFVTNCKKPKPAKDSDGDDAQEARMMLMSCPEYPCGGSKY